MTQAPTSVGLSGKQQAMLAMIALFITSIASTQLPADAPQWLHVAVGLLGVVVIGIKELLPPSPGQ
jgi:hypothetical protein